MTDLRISSEKEPLDSAGALTARLRSLGVGLNWDQKERIFQRYVCLRFLERESACNRTCLPTGLLSISKVRRTACRH